MPHLTSEIDGVLTAFTFVLAFLIGMRLAKIEPQHPYRHTVAVWFLAALLNLPLSVWVMGDTFGVWLAASTFYIIVPLFGVLVSHRKEEPTQTQKWQW